jgi:hypothetical protein
MNQAVQISYLIETCGSNLVGMYWIGIDKSLTWKLGAILLKDMVITLILLFSFP